MYSLIFLLYAASGGELDPKRLKMEENPEKAIIAGKSIV
jgi:hypothetical protein